MLMKKYSDGNNYTKIFIEKYSTEKTIIISVDIENQINELEDNEKIIWK